MWVGLERHPAACPRPVAPAPLTKRQNDVYEFIRSSFRRHGRPPTMMEIGAALGIASTNAVSKHLRALAKKGYVRRAPNEARAIELLEGFEGLFDEDEVPSLPVVGRTDSSAPQGLWRRPRGFLYTDPLVLGARDPDRCLVGRAGDDGMSDAGIFKGDYLVIEDRPWEELDIVRGFVAGVLLGDLLVARHLVAAGEGLTLVPSHRSYPEVAFVPGDDGCHVIGPVLGAMRRVLG